MSICPQFNKECKYLNTFSTKCRAHQLSDSVSAVSLIHGVNECPLDDIVQKNTLEEITLYNDDFLDVPKN